MVCSWVSNGILVALESWHTLCWDLFFPFLDLKQGCKVSQWRHYSAEVSLPKNWVNEKPKSLIEPNTHSYADVLPSLPPTRYSAFISLSSTSQPCVLLLFLDNYVSSGDEREVCQWSALASVQVSVSRSSSEPAPQMIWGEGFTVDQFNIVIEAINVTVSKWECELECSLGLYISQNSLVIHH